MYNIIIALFYEYGNFWILIENFCIFLISLFGSEKYEIPKFGWTSVIKSIQNCLKDVSINLQLNQSVIQIRDMEQRYAAVKTSRGDVFFAKVAIIASPWQAVNKIHFEPRISPNFIDRVRRRDAYIVSALLVYPAPIWMNCNKSGYIFDYKQRLMAFEYAPCTLSCQLYFNSMFNIPIDPGQYLVELLTKYYGMDMLFPLKLELKIFEQAQLIDFPEMDSNNSNVIIWASSNSGLSWRGFINGAVQASNRASVLTLSLLRPNLISAFHIRDIDPAASRKRQKSTNIIQRIGLSLNIISVVRLIKVTALGIISYWCWKRLYHYKIATL